MPLKETDFGWRTDGKVYTDEQIRDMWVSAALVGAVPVNNEVNMISGRCYLAKNYFKRMIREFPGMKNFVAIPGKLTMTQSGALVEYTATWELNGKADILARTGNSAIPVRLNAGMGADGAIGKAERKILASVFVKLTGSAVSDGDADDFDEITATPTVQSNGTAHAVPQQSLPEPEKPAQQTQTQAVTEKLKKQRVAKTETTAAPAATAEEEVPPWGKDDEQSSESQQQEPPPMPAAAVVQPAQPAAATTQVVVPMDSKAKAVGFVKNPTTGEMEKVIKQAKATPVAETQKPTQPPTPPAESAQAMPVDTAGSGEIEVDRIGLIASVRTFSKQVHTPYKIMSQSATEYLTNDQEMAKKAKGYKDTNVPVEIEYTQDAEKKLWIVEVRPEGSSQDGQQDGADGGDFEQP